jgi:hypothetical protein
LFFGSVSLKQGVAAKHENSANNISLLYESASQASEAELLLLGVSHFARQINHVIGHFVVLLGEQPI